MTNAKLRIDSRGIINSISEGRGADADIELAGPVIPGMPNCHSHAFQRQMAGLAGHVGPSGANSFWSWRDAMYRLANRLTPESLEAIASWLYVEMLESGYTSCAEFHYLHHQPDGSSYASVEEMSRRLLDAASRAGLSLTLLPVLYCRSGFDSDNPLPEQRRFINTPDRFMALFERCLDAVRDNTHHVVGLGLHSLRAVSQEQMDAVLDSEAGRAAAVHIHIAEQTAEVSQCEKAYGARPVEWLLANAPVDGRWCLVHATHMNEQEYESTSSSGAVAGLCPTTEADLGDGFFEAERFLARNGSIAIGSDSNLRISPSEELRWLEFGLRLRTGRRNVLASEARSCGRLLFESALDGGRLALGQPVGRIEEGVRADLVELDGCHPMLQDVGDDDLLDRYVFAGGRSMIRSVFVGGRQHVRDGRHVARESAAAGFAKVMEVFGQ